MARKQARCLKKYLFFDSDNTTIFNSEKIHT